MNNFKFSLTNPLEGIEENEPVSTLVKRRSSTVEPVLGTLINYHTISSINARGKKAANKHVLMAALSYNLKKYLKFIRKHTKMMVLAMQPPSRLALAFVFWSLPHSDKVQIKDSLINKP